MDDTSKGRKSLGDLRADTLEPGLTAELQTTVTPGNTAKHLGSGDSRVFATPAMIMLMERTAARLTAAHLPPGLASVGIGVNVRHLAATPMGMTVTAKVKLVQVQGRKLTFQVEAFDDQEKIGEGTHERMIIDVARFTEKVKRKLSA